MTLLLNGQVLVVGGYGSGFVAASELYDPVAGTWQTSGALNTVRQFQTATLLSNGKVLIAGGETPGVPGVTPTNSVELCDPVSGTFTPTSSMHIARYSHTASLLGNGQVLVAG